MTDYVLTGLVKRRAELAGEIEALHEKLSGLLRQMEALDGTIVQFDPNYRVGSIKPRTVRPPADWCARGEMMRLILSVLRRATEPMTTQEIALDVMRVRALDVEDRKLRELVVKRVLSSVRRQRDNGTVRSLPGPGASVLWEVNRGR